MEISEKLNELGWFLSAEGIQQIGEDGNITDVRTLSQKALDFDLREVGAAGFPEDIAKGKLESIPGKIIVQIQKVRNISAPKANEESKSAPRMLKLILTDGQVSCQAVELENISSLSLNTPPGTKMYLKDETFPMAHGLLLLKSSCVEVLGGKVPALVEKWELNRSLAKHTRGRIGEEGGPPPWIPFGQKILRSNPHDRNFKSLDNKDKENKENSEFEAQRKDAIAEAAKGGAKKVFGGGNKPLLDHNVQQIVDCGFTVEQAEYALRQSRNNVERALRTLQKRVEGAGHEDGQRGERTDGKQKGEERERKKRNQRDRDEESGVASKPSGSLSLFDFVQNKLPFQSDKESDHKPSYMGSTFDHKLSSGDMNKGGMNPRGGRSDVTLQSRGSNRGNRSGRGGRGSSTWNSGSERGNSNSLYHHSNTMHREERIEKGKHGSNMGSGIGGSSQQQQQKPPRFQNQQRYQQQQQQQQQHHHPPGHDVSYGQQNWVNSYNQDSSYGGTWPGRNTLNNVPNKPRADYHRDSYGTVDYIDSNRKKSTRNQHLGSENYGNKFETPLDAQTSHNLGGRNDGVGNIQTFGHNDDLALNSAKYSNHTSGGLSHESFDTSSYSRHQNEQTTQMYVDFYVKKAPPSGQSNSHSVPNVTSTPSYGGSVYSPQTNFSSMVPSGAPPSNQYMSDSKVWRWHKGDKCMAKYWEDNMYYNAVVTGVSERTCVVRFVEYGNFEEVLHDDCIPFTEDGLGHSIQTTGAFLNSVDSMQSQNYNQNHFSGILEFRRGGTRPYIKSGGGEATGNRERRPPRIQQQMYVPPAQRK